MKPAFDISDPARLREVLFGFRISRTILTAYELDIFSHVAPDGTCSEVVSQKIRSDARATDRLMNALCAIGLLKKRNEKFFNTSFSAQYLSKKSPKYLYGLMHTANMWDTWSTMTVMVKTGNNQKDNVISRNDENWPDSFIGAMHERAILQSKLVLDKLDLTDVRHFFDIGGGSGAYAMEFVKRSPEHKATVFDLPGIIPITKKYVKKEGLTKQFRFICGDYNKNSLGNSYDLVFLSAIIHINSPSQNQMLLKKCFRALNPGGTIIIQDHIMDKDRTSPFDGAMFALNMLVSTESGDTYTESEISAWLKNAGFAGIHRIETFKNAMMVAKKSV
ncbi:MAG TPA: methyltransferase [Bacteroidales bacterium]|nr:methyltransferase [Bacteroidales bacterium]